MRGGGGGGGAHRVQVENAGSSPPGVFLRVVLGVLLVWVCLVWFLFVWLVWFCWFGVVFFLIGHRGKR